MNRPVEGTALPARKLSVPIPAVVDCPACFGEGEIRFSRSLRGDPQLEDYEPCPDCHGEGRAPNSEVGAA